MKRTIFLILSLLPLISHTHDYLTYAHQWKQRYLVDAHNLLTIPVADFAVLLDVVTLSRDRSLHTLNAQEKALHALTTLLQAWTNIASTRLNPSHERPFTVERHTCLQHIEDFWQAYDIQEKSSAQYNAITQQAVYGNALASTQAQQALAELRTQARVYMLEALADARVHLATVYEQFFKQHSELQEPYEQMFAELQTKMADMCAEQPELRSFSVGEFLLTYLPSLAIHTFIQADKRHNQLSTETWQAYIKLQEIGNYVWHAIETARSAYYQAVLNTLATIA